MKEVDGRAGAAGALTAEAGLTTEVSVTAETGLTYEAQLTAEAKVTAEAGLAAEAGRAAGAAVAEGPGSGPVADQPGGEQPVGGALLGGRALGGALLGGQLLSAVSAVRRTTRRAARNASGTEPLPPARSELLRLAARQPGITVAEAARELRLAPNTVSTMVGRLTEQGLLTRGRSSCDGRTVRLAVTAAARQRLARWKDLRAELAGRALDRLPAEDRDAIAAAVPALLRLAEQMEDV